MTLYNPIGRPVKHWVHIPVTGSAYTVLGPNGESIQTQVGPALNGETEKEINIKWTLID